MQLNEYKLLEFQVSWCSPCQKMKPFVKEAVESTKNVDLVVVDVDEEPDMARMFKVRSIPMLVLLKGEDVVGTMVGLRNVNEIKSFLKTE